MCFSYFFLLPYSRDKLGGVPASTGTTLSVKGGNFRPGAIPLLTLSSVGLGLHQMLKTTLLNTSPSIVTITVLIVLKTKQNYTLHALFSNCGIL